MKRLIVITGLDGTGTSSVGDALAARLRGRLVHTPAEPFRGLRGVIDCAPRDESPAAHYLFYLASLVHADVTLIRPALEYADVVCVRHLVDTVVSHRAAGLGVAVEYSTALYDLRPPDRIFFLTAEESVRRQRLAARKKYDHLDRALDDEALRRRFLEEYDRLGPTMTTIDTTLLSVNEVVAALETMLKGAT